VIAPARHDPFQLLRTAQGVLGDPRTAGGRPDLVGGHRTGSCLFEPGPAGQPASSREVDRQAGLRPDAAPAASEAGRAPLREQLAAAAHTIEERWRLMTDPVWALADMALIKTLLQAPDAVDWEERLKKQARARFPFDSLRSLLEGFAVSSLPMSADLRRLADRLDAWANQTWPSP
jgi:hypothetical protein